MPPNLPSKTGSSVLLVDSDGDRRSRLQKALTAVGIEVMVCPDGYLARCLLRDRTFDLVVSNRHLPSVDGLELLRYIKEKLPALPVILLTGSGSIQDAVEAFKLGAQDYLTIPFPDDALILKTQEILELRRLQQENLALQDKLASAGDKPPDGIVGQSDGMQKVYELIRTVAPMDVTVLIYGESGTGKEVVSRAIHAHSSRKEGPFIKVSCSIFVPSLLESELFGHEKGAFTGAIYARVGRFEQAKGGTIFLDDIDDLSLEIQTKLLRVLQDGEVERVGGGRVIPVDVRVVVASKRSLKELIEEKKFREDLFYRINVVPIHLPPLRERPEDIPLLVQHFLLKYCSKYDRSRFSFTDEILDCFLAYPWPGNVRELENTIKRLTVLCHAKPVTMADLPTEIQSGGLGKNRKFSITGKPELTLNAYMDTAEKSYLREVLENCGWRISESARSLGISRKSLWERMRRHGITHDVTKK